MSTISKLKQSRNNWKGKSIRNGKKARYRKRELARIKKERGKYKKEAEEAKKLLKQITKENNLQICTKEDLIFVVLRLFLVARIGFRAISRVIEVLSDYLGIKKKHRVFKQSLTGSPVYH